MMGCPVIVREGWAAGSYGYIKFDILTGDICKNIPCKGMNETIHCGGQKDILENIYAEEINCFINRIMGMDADTYTYRMGAIASGALAAAEKSFLSKKIEKVEPMIQPAILPDMY